jgi:hypothetical protein
LIRLAEVFGHEGLIGANWEVLGNDHYGDSLQRLATCRQLLGSGFHQHFAFL